MRKLRVSTLVTLDGVIQDPGGFGEIAKGGWGNAYFTQEAQEEAYGHLMESDYFLSGRVTFELMSKAWGGIKGGPYLERMSNIPKLVASRTLTGPLAWNATVLQGDVAEEIARLKGTPGKDIEMYGSASLMQTLMKHDLIDEYRIWVHPLVLGAGKRLFSDSGQPAKLQLTGTKVLASGVAILTYEPESRRGTQAAGEDSVELGIGELEHNKRTAVAFYTQVLNDKDPAGAVARYVGATYIQHNPDTADGKEALIESMRELFARAPQVHVEIKRVIAEGDRVAIHNLVTKTPGDRGAAGVDIFRLADGKIVEHWDVRQPVPEHSANDNTMF